MGVPSTALPATHLRMDSTTSTDTRRDCRGPHTHQLPPSPHHFARVGAGGKTQTGAITSVQAGLALLRKGGAKIPPFNEVHTVRHGLVLSSFCTHTFQLGH